MLPAGEVTESTIATLLPQLARGDLLVDGGNANYKDTLRRAANANAVGIEYADVGVSGGVGPRQRLLRDGWSERRQLSASEAVAGSAGAVADAWDRPRRCRWFRALRQMVHNGIEYGMMQALAKASRRWRRKKSSRCRLPTLPTPGVTVRPCVPGCST